MNTKNNKVFMGMVFVMILLFVFIGGAAFYLVKSTNRVLYDFILTIILIITLFLSFFTLVSMIIMIRILYNKQISSFSINWLKYSLRVIYSNIMYLSSFVRIDKDSIRSVFAQINNKLILSSHISVSKEDILILLPHCIQKSICPHKITTNIENCKRCGLCNIDELLKLKEKYKVQIFVATGGTLARKIIKELKPKLIIAVACERDLSSGIKDVQSIPVIGILNERPEGPCVNTCVNVEKIEKTIKYFIGEEE
ncbi:DUF116 domain-containing protein [Inediibacterium massiliense]|uniref:DUF116 domain-containing protein n=1 Tax=Inediibacterium massiliense TaxID=1658111 RepID=UPI0018FE0523|nr:DUF116 domain-containing protein [Inediibacterium massiliense]